VLYGEGALAGVINFVPKRPILGRRAFSTLVSGGSLETGRLAADLNLPVGDKVAIRAIASGNRSAGYIDDTDAEFLTASLGVRAQPNDRVTIDVGVDYSTDDLRTAYYGTPLVPASVARDPADIVQTPTGLVFDRALQTSNFNVENAGYGADTTIVRSQLRYRVNDVFTFTNLISYYDSGHRFLDNAINFTYVPATRLVTLGANHSPLDPYAPVRGLAPANDPPSAFPTATTEGSTVGIAAVFVENALNLTDRWLIAGGLRYETSTVDRTTFNARTNAQSTFARSFDPVSWRIGSVVDLTPRTQLYAQTSSAVVPVAGLTLIPLASAEFDLTTGTSVEAGVKNSLFGGRIDLTLGGYRIRQERIITRDPNDFNISIQGGRRSSKGVEAAASAAVTPQFRVDASYTALDSRFDELLEAGGVSRAGRTPPGTPETIANLFAVYALQGLPLTVTGTVRHEGRTFLDNANTVRVNGHTTLDASIGYRFRLGDLTLRGRNLTDQLYADSASPAINQVVLGPPRTVDLTFTVRY